MKNISSSKFGLRVQDLFLPISVIIIAVLMRIVPHPANIVPIAAMALFGGAYFPIGKQGVSKLSPFLFPLLAMFLSDLFLGFSSSTPYVYVSFLLISGIGFSLRERKTVSSVLIASFVSSVLFYLITNFGFWLANDLYPKTFAGQLDAYILGLPFF